jgi:hypothetical protein
MIDLAHARGSATHHGMQQAPSHVFTLRLASYGTVTCLLTSWLDTSVRTFILHVCAPCDCLRTYPPPALRRFQPDNSTVVAVPFLTHFADLSSWEYAQKLQQKGLPELQQMGVKVRLVQQHGICG